ncbi:MAG: Dyp-type peroxidase [Motilibacteraceae bacterium]
MTPQPGIFALGTAAQCYLELDRRDGVDVAAFVAAVAALDEPSASMGGANVVVGFRPGLWDHVAGDDAPRGVRGFDEPVVGPDGFVMPATQHDGWIWVAGASRDVVFDVATGAVAVLRDLAEVADEVDGWPYHRVRDLTGFIDGTENPPVVEAPEVALVPDGEPGAGASVVLVQKWRHLAREWSALDPAAQEKVIGRTKPDSVELAEDVMPENSHVSRTVVEEGGEELEIFRRNTPYGGVRDHGTYFVGFCGRQRVLHVMLERMAGVGDGLRDALTHYAEPLSGAYYVVPSVEALRRQRR